MLLAPGLESVHKAQPAHSHWLSSIALPISKKDVASYLGLTPDTLSRRLAGFEENGWIHQHGNRRIDLLDIEALRLV